MRRHSLPATRSNEHPHQSGAEVDIERLEQPRSDQIESNEHLGDFDLNTIGRHGHLGLPNAEHPMDGNLEAPPEEPRTPLERPSNEGSRSQTEADELWGILKAETGY